MKKADAKSTGLSKEIHPGLLVTHYLEHARTACWASALHGFTAIGHDVLLGIFHVALGFTLHAVGFNGHGCRVLVVPKSRVTDDPDPEFHRTLVNRRFTTVSLLHMVRTMSTCGIPSQMYSSLVVTYPNEL